MTAYAAPPVDPTAVVPRRIGAWAIDLVIAFFFVNLLLSLFGVTGVQKDFDTTAAAHTYCDRWGDTKDGLCLVLPYQGTSSGPEATATAFEHPERIVLALVLNLLLYGLLQGIGGASTGKRLLGLVVVDPDGRPIGVERSLVRTGMWVVDGIFLGLPLVGGILLFIARGHQRLGDQVAHTYVVPTSQVGRPVVIPRPGLPVAYPPPPPATSELFGRYPSPGPTPPAPPPPPEGVDHRPPPPTDPWRPTTPTSPEPVAPLPTAPVRPVEDVRAPTTDGPHWDEVRDTYILYRRDEAAWLEWDVVHGKWKPIDQ